VPAEALLLALAAAALHAVWNLLLARAGDVEAATAVALVVAAVAFAPAAVATWDVDDRAAPYVAASALLELAYFALLAAAYRRADLSLVYPISRGVAPVLVLVVAVAALGADTTSGQAVGVVVIATGVLLVHRARTHAGGGGTVFALAIAGCIAAYTLVDNEGIRHAAPLPYLELVLAGPALAYAAAVAAAKGPSALRAEITAPALGAGLAMFGAYALVLAALELAPAAPVAALRETSVVIATALAAVFLGERVTRGRLVGAALVVAGIVALATAG
jgi:drug/metabolite transporter (DMT)-like permease